MFKGTIRENLLYGWSGATTEDLLEVATIAQIDKKILSLPSQWEEHVGNWGRFFSGGERQRLALARTLLQRPRFLILDECTSAVDAQTESAILKGISDFANVTTIIISHRQSSIDWADRTIVLNDGRCEEATHSRSSLSESGLFVNR